MTPEKRKLFFLIAILAAVTGSYLEVQRHERLKDAPPEQPIVRPRE